MFRKDKVAVGHSIPSSCAAQACTFHGNSQGVPETGEDLGYNGPVRMPFRTSADECGKRASLFWKTVQQQILLVLGNDSFSSSLSNCEARWTTSHHLCHYRLCLSPWRLLPGYCGKLPGWFPRAAGSNYCKISGLKTTFALIVLHVRGLKSRCQQSPVSSEGSRVAPSLPLLALGAPRHSWLMALHPSIDLSLCLAFSLSLCQISLCLSLIRHLPLGLGATLYPG